MVTGLLTNLVNTIYKSGSLYFSTINVIVALLASWFTRYSKRTKILRCILFVVLTAFVCTVLEIIIQILIPEIGFSDSVLDVTEKLYSGDGKMFFATITIVSFFLNIADKGISFLVAFLIYKLTPDSLKEILINLGWKQKPLSLQEIRAFRKKTGTNSFQKKVTILLSSIIILLSFILTWISISFYYEDCKEEYSSEAFGTVKSAAALIDASQVNEYVKWGDKAPGYKNTQKILQSILNCSQGVVKISVYIAENNGYFYIFQEAKKGVPMYDNGKIIPYETDEKYSSYVERMKKGESIDEIMLYDNGRIYMAVEPVRNSAGETVCYVVSEVYMSFLSTYTKQYLLKTFLCFSGCILCSPA